MENNQQENGKDQNQKKIKDSKHSLEKEIYEEKIREYIKKQTEKTYKGLFKDIEITKKQFLTLYLIAVCFASTLMIDIFLTIDLGTRAYRNFPLQSGFFIIIGVAIGFLIGGFTLDKVKGKRYPLLFKILLLSVLITTLHIGFFRRTGDLVPSLFFLTNSVIAGILYIFLATYFIDFTTILERGRVYSYLIILLIITLGIMFFLIANEILITLPVLIIIGAIIYLYKNKEEEKPYKPIVIGKDSTEINIRIIKYIIMIAFFGFTIGMLTNFFIVDIEIFYFGEWPSVLTFVVVFIAVSFSLITGISVGAVFDFYGRKTTVSSIILAISIVNFLRLFEINIPYFGLTVFFAAFLASFMTVPLLMSDITERKDLGKVFGISFAVMLFSIILGLFTAMNIPTTFFANKYTREIFIIGVINLGSIISLFLLSNIEETVNPKEQNWPDYLIHLFVIHESGMLLYEKSFKPIDEDAIESDLASGGFIGLITMLQEITKEEKKLRVIDHGGKKILFGFSKNKKLIFALILTEELRILRNKLDHFIEDIERKFSLKDKAFSGVDVNLWKKRIDPILERHFQRKYFELIPEIPELVEVKAEGRGD
ncbi:MAG: hypothetical protein R6U96_03545 [Promethearchaeia archaeon]